jgi:DNA adenine methylase
MRRFKLSSQADLFCAEQLTITGNLMMERVVNVASVPQRTPFRYPGGKTWLVPVIRDWLRNMNSKPAVFFEPFTGGGIISLTVAFEKLANRVVMVELDEEIAAVWKTILSEDNDWLSEKILTFRLSVENVLVELSKPSESTRQKAFQTILKNRTYHGGILAHGSGLIKNGENGKGISSRWYPKTLADRITAIKSVRDKIEFIEGDGIEVMAINSHQKNAVFFIDPPYTAAGKKAGTRLYKYFDLDHDKLFSVTKEISGDFLMTYDNAQGVIDLANRYNFDVHTVPMKNTHHATMVELLIGRNLDWAR